MLTFHCPYCDTQACETELSAGGEAHITRADIGADDAAFEAYLFTRKNPKNVHFERWRHVYGCGKWFHAARCTVTLQVFGTYSAQTTAPPQDILDKITKARPDWSYDDWKGA